ncbi:RICIN domain-containing protein [Marinimicrobium sp. LS-A18]|uniref:RICIN domain-containing protein n=1 Tax=Marinimicrobium sp. LS-A18 TaxID=1381596 RepID=UPI00046595C4|nr:RICIN domain-containing protein [Marinimicrobium sp. LS-A18]
MRISLESAGQSWLRVQILAAVLLSMTFLSLPSFAAQTADNSRLHTWWHENYEENDQFPVADNQVRRSTFYDVKVSTASDPGSKFDSFTYMNIPRSGKGKIGYDGETDGAEFADSANLTMSWNSFLYSEDVWVEVSLRTGQTVGSVDEVTIRPENLNFQKEMVDSSTIRIRVPYSDKGYRFSVEFDNQLYTAYNDMSDDSGNLTEYGGGNNRAIHTEPRNALMIFSEPVLTGGEQARTVPSDSDGSIHYPNEGEVRNLNNVDADIIYFRPGTYYMGWDHHTVFSESSPVKWVYLAPGAYVKGAFRFKSPSSGLFKVTGYGVLSGEQYIYEADTNNGYNHLDQNSSNCHVSCVKMLQFESGSGQQHLDLQGITINEPPYHSFVVYGQEDRFTMRVNNYKQVGSWVWQTDGIELYAGSTMHNAFFHANDDVLKMYHSDVSVYDTVIWKGENGPVIQWGWDHRNLNNILVKNTDVIHSRLYWRDEKTNFCIINASPHWNGAGSNGGYRVSGMTIEDINVEGMTMCAIRIYSLVSIDSEAIRIKNLHIDQWNDLDSSAHVNRFEAIGNVNIGNNALVIENFTVGDEYVTTDNGNTGENQLGRFGFELGQEKWQAFQTDVACAPQAIIFPAIPDQDLGSSVTLDAYADSGLPVSYSVLGAEAALVDGYTVDVGGTNGEVTVTASQAGSAGDQGYCPVSESRSFYVGERPPEPAWIGGSFGDWSLQPMSYNATSQQFEHVVQLEAGDYQMKFADTDDWSGDDWGDGYGLDSSVELTTGEPDSNSHFSISQSDEYTISFDRSNLSYSISSGDPGDPCEAQVISMPSIADRDLSVDDSVFDVDVTSDSGLPVSLSIEGPGAVSGTTVDLSGASGTVSLTASQAGDSEYCAATPVTRSFDVMGTAGHQSAMYIGASFNSWTPESEPMELSNGVWIASEVQVPAGSHQLKFANTSDWSGEDWGGAEGLVGTAVETTGGAPNISFSVPTTGSYTITFDDVTATYSIEPAACGDDCNTTGITAGLTYVITAKHSGKALDVAGVSSNNGAAIHQWEYIGGANQQWLVEAAGEGTYKLLAIHSSKTLDITGGSAADGADAHQWESLPVASQRWSLEDAGEGYFYIVNSNSGKALAVSDASMDNGSAVRQYHIDESDHFKWSFEEL